MKTFAVFVMLFCLAVGENGTMVPDINTTTAPKTTPLVTTTASYDTDELQMYKYAENNTVCLLVQFKGHFWKNKDVWHISSDAAINNKSSECGKLRVTFHSGEFTIGFKQVGKSYVIDAVTAELDKVGNAEAQNLSLAKVSNGSSYLCSSGITVPLSNNVTFEMVDVQLQPFYVKDGKFATAEVCDISALVPIIVGAVLALLVLIVIIAYFIGRNRNRVGYEEI